MAKIYTYVQPNNAKASGGVSQEYVDAELAKKLNATGHVLTDNNYTTAEKTKLSGIASGANNYAHPNDANTRHVTDAEKTTWNGKANGTHTHTRSQITDFTHTHQELIDLIDALSARIDALENPVV